MNMWIARNKPQWIGVEREVRVTKGIVGHREKVEYTGIVLDLPGPTVD